MTFLLDPGASRAERTPPSLRYSVRCLTQDVHEGEGKIGVFHFGDEEAGGPGRSCLPSIVKWADHSAQLLSPASPTRPWLGMNQDSRATQGLSGPGRGSTCSLADHMKSSLGTPEGPAGPIANPRSEGAKGRMDLNRLLRMETRNARPSLIMQIIEGTHQPCVYFHITRL